MTGDLDLDTDLDLPAVPEQGLPSRLAPPKTVLIIGAGMAGLIAGHELLRRGHRPVILEARQRVGGRVHTVRDFAPGLYAEAGAMRIPRIHELTLAYCRALRLRLRPCVVKNPRALVHVGGRRLTAEQVRDNPALLPYALTKHERGRENQDLWWEATEEIREIHRTRGAGALDELIAKYDAYSIRGFLKARGWSEGAIEQYGVLTFTESTLNTGIIQEFREMLGAAYDDVYEIVGGMDRLPLALYDQLKGSIRFGTEVLGLAQDDAGVTVRARLGTDIVRFRADYAICTLPFSVLRGVEVSPGFSPGKQRAIRQLHYDCATKVFLQVRRRHWEEVDGIVGGTTVTDLPVRRIVYPGPNAGEDRAILLASYTWGQDAAQWSALPTQQRIERARRDVATIHPGIERVIEGGFSYAWGQDPYSMGAYALFEPDQQTHLRADIERAEGRIHFAGEHCSRWPAWIEGAIESGVRAAYRVHTDHACAPGEVGGLHDGSAHEVGATAAAGLGPDIITATSTCARPVTDLVES